MATQKKLPSSRFLSVAETAALLGVCSKTIERRTADGTLASIRLGRLIRIPKQQVEELLAAAQAPKVLE